MIRYDCRFQQLSGSVRSAQLGKHLLHERWPAVPDQYSSASELLPLALCGGAVCRWTLDSSHGSVCRFRTEDVERSLQHPAPPRVQTNALPVPPAIQRLSTGRLTFCEWIWSDAKVSLDISPARLSGIPGPAVEHVARATERNCTESGHVATSSSVQFKQRLSSDDDRWTHGTLRKFPVESIVFSPQLWFGRDQLQLHDQLQQQPQ